MGAAALGAAGCKPGGESSQWLINGLIDPTQSGQFLAPRRNEIRSSLSILEEPLGIQNAEEPTPEDGVAEYTETKINPGDTLNVTIFELLVPGQASVQQVTVGNSGYEALPVLGRVRMSGLSTGELELAVKEKLREMQVLDDAQVQISMVETRSARFSIVGSVQRPGGYLVPQPDYRLLNALAEAGGVPPQIERVYVFRRGAAPLPQATSLPASAPAGVIGPASSWTPALITLSDVPTSHSATTSSAPVATSRPKAVVEPTPTSHSATTNSASVVTSRPKAAAEQQATSSSSPAAPTAATSAPIDELKILEGGPVGKPEVPDWDPEKGWILRPQTSQAAQPTPGHAPPTTASKPSGEETAEAAEELAPAVRIIEIPMKELLAGDPRYNVVIRPFDLINVPPGNVGEYYMMGNITRQGAYDMTGRRLTVKEAVASAGGFGSLAWPSRADLIRRVSRDEEQIIQLDLDAVFAGNAPDFYLKPNDIVNVGTTPAAVFLAVLRNAFRFSYGFGFVYDRNFADSDSFQAKEQVKSRKLTESQIRGIPLN